MKHSLYVLSLLFSFAVGGLVSDTGSKALSERDSNARPADGPAYLVAVGTRLKPPEALAEYRRAAGPLAMTAGYQLLATQPAKTSVQVLEGQWPYEGFVTLEKFRSMKELLAFWNSAGYQSAKKLRADAIKMDFIIAFEGNPLQ